MIKDSDGGKGGDSRPEGDSANFSWVNPRKHPRFQARLNIRTNGAMPGSMTTRNISLGGAFGETSQVFPVGAQVAFILYPQRGVAGNKEIKFRAKVLRTGAEAERGKTVNLAAVCFIKFEQNRLEALRKLLQNLSEVVFSGYPAP